MQTNIVNKSRDYKVDAVGIVRRILEHAPEGSIDDLSEVVLMDDDPTDKGFARYLRNERRIELYLNDILGWEPWILRKSYISPYLAIGLALGHEIDHHVHRNHDDNFDKEASAEKNALKYVYPSFGIFKPLLRFIHFFIRKTKGRAFPPAT